VVVQENHRTAFGFVTIAITSVVISYIPGQKRIAKMVFQDKLGGSTNDVFTFKSWEGNEPEALIHEPLEPPDQGDGAVWRFVGLSGSFISHPIQNQVLARVSPIWKKT